MLVLEENSLSTFCGSKFLALLGCYFFLFQAVFLRHHCAITPRKSVSISSKRLRIILPNKNPKSDSKFFNKKRKITFLIYTILRVDYQFRIILFRSRVFKSVHSDRVTTHFSLHRRNFKPLDGIYRNSKQILVRRKYFY